MKYLSTKEEELVDKKLKLKVVVIPPTNITRFALYDIGQDESLAGRIKMAEYLMDNCIVSIQVGATAVPPEKMKLVDLTDEASAAVYFACVDLVVNYQMGVGADEKK